MLDILSMKFGQKTASIWKTHLFDSYNFYSDQYSKISWHLDL